MDFLHYSLEPISLVDLSKDDMLTTLTMDFDDMYLMQQTTFANQVAVDEELKKIIIKKKILISKILNNIKNV